MKNRAELNAERSISSPERLPQGSALVGSGAHVSRNPDFIKPFIRRGYTPLIIPSLPLPHPDIAGVLWILL